MTVGDSATVMVSVAVPPAIAWAVFTEEIDQWWQRGMRFRNGAAELSRMVLEPGLGGRLIELVGPADAARAVEIGSVTGWDAPTRLVLNWRNSNFTAQELTQVEVNFAAFGQGTRVTVKHSGWQALPADHPARHGQAAAAFIRSTGLWWGDVLGAFVLYAAARGQSRGLCVPHQ